ncbi:2-isopropylmalate synthase [Nocardia pseudobrasiliensis]|uniref:2-isopropylmalate synthase n=1 Tax=Nocardia pseudobrasiliensis TaxID=45979 RepID=A0A370I0V3_9NOCA|nr:2-isopropylmalate synthase [Nocardia pseudobrasiliensis]RDI62864.1 2-isopropylmalate synthase [Nocardia pseudobrasiliensis]
MLSFPTGHRPRYGDFEIRAVSDETIREGCERAPFGADDRQKLRLIEAVTAAGVTDIDVGSGITEPTFVRSVLDDKFLLGRIPEAAQFSFNLTLKTWEPLVAELERRMPKEYLAELYVSVGMIEIDSGNQLFERVVDRLRGLGITKLRSSLLNAFGITVDEDKYEHLNRQLERCRQQGITLVRINDSVGTLVPDSTAVLAANLVHDNPEFTFYLHGHNDRGLGTANSLTSVFHGFQMIEGGVAGTGNRAGLAELESIAATFADNNITVAAAPLDVDKLGAAARLSEEVFLTAPDPYRAVSGFLVRNENAGIVNVPDYLGVSRGVDYFLNRIGLFPAYIRQILAEGGMDPQILADDAFIEDVYARLATHMDRLFDRKQVEFTRLSAQIKSFYDDIVRLDEVYTCALEALRERSIQRDEPVVELLSEELVS